MLTPLTRRGFLAENAMGIGAVALAWLNSQQAGFAALWDMDGGVISWTAAGFDLVS